MPFDRGSCTGTSTCTRTCYVHGRLPINALMIGLLLLATLSGAGCKSTECGTGTIDRNGVCAPPDETVGSAGCGPFMMLQGDQCVPMFPPTVCDPATTMPSTDPMTGVTTCIGTGGGGCGAPFACPTPTSGKQTICGQLYDFEDNSKLQGPSPSGTACTTATASGPCALMIAPYDAIAYGNNPTGTAPLASDAVYIDDCGRYRVPNITLSGGPFIALGIDDAGQPLGPAGITNTTGVALPSQPNAANQNFEAYIVTKTVTDLWESTGGPPVSGGVYVGVFRTHVCSTTGVCTGDSTATQGGVTFTKSGATEPTDDYYFMTETTHDHVDPVATATSINGTGLLTGASVNDSLVYSGTGGITDTVNCKWETHAAASLPNIVFFQIYRPINSSFDTTCTQ
jgi:hypothetical protein